MKISNVYFDNNFANILINKLLIDNNLFIVCDIPTKLQKFYSKIK